MPIYTPRKVTVTIEFKVRSLDSSSASLRAVEERLSELRANGRYDASDPIQEFKIIDAAVSPQ